MKNVSPTKYSTISQTFHWLTAILVLVAFVYGPGGPEQWVYSAGMDFERHLHETLGMAVFGISLLRMAWKFFDTKPQPISLARWMEISSKALQGFLYLLLLAVPLTAVLGAWLEGHAVVLLTGQVFAPQLATSHTLGTQISEIHAWLGDLILWLAGAHAAAAIYHQAVLKDAVLVTMLPNWAERRITLNHARTSTIP
jgi:cytochrome b561